MNVSSALSEILDICEVDERAQVNISGTEPALPSPVKLATAGAAALAGVGSVISNLWQLRGGQPQTIDLSMQHAAAAMRSYEFLSRDGEPIIERWRGLSGFYQCAQGRWIRFHCNFPHHDAAVRRVLECDGDKDTIQQAVMKWDAQTLEDAVLDAGGCAYMIRSKKEWRAHPHAQALKDVPLMEIIRIGDSPPRAMPKGPRPLSGIRALDLTRVIAGPVIGRTLAEHGAEVMRIASPALPFIEPLVMDTGHGKYSAHLDLNLASDRDQLRLLLNDADIFTQAYRPGAIARHGFAPEDIARDFPGTVYVTLSAWSHKGPWASRRGFDSLVQCATGWASELGGPDTPELQPAQAIDYVSGYLGALGAIEALRRRAKEGGTWMVRLSLAQTAQWIDGLGRNTEPDIRAVPVSTSHDLADMMTETEGPFGRFGHLKPVLRMSATPPTWQQPVAPLGYHAPAWPSLLTNERISI